MLRIGQFSDTFLPVMDGVGRVALAYAETLGRLGHQVTVVAPHFDTGDRKDDPFELVDFVGLTLPGMKAYKVGKATLDPHYLSQIRRIPLDILHSHSPFSAGGEALRIASHRGLPLVTTFHSKYYDDFLKSTGSKAIARAVVRHVLSYYRRCDEVWAVSDATADVLREYGYEGEIVVMPNGVTLREADPDAVAEAERRWGLGQDPVILFTGQMNWKKNILTVLEACAALCRDGKAFRLVLAGQGPDLKPIENKIHDLGLDSRAVLTGHVTDMRLLDGLYSRASVFAFPSLYDNAPMVVREAAVMGTPSVLVRGSSAAEIITDGDNGFLCDNDSADLARVLSRVLADPAAARQAGLRARDTIPVPWDAVLETAVGRYERLVALYREGKGKRKRPHGRS